MKRTITKVIATIMLFVMAIIPGLTACNIGGNGGTQGGENGSIKISYYKGGTGGAWIEAIAAEFTKDTGIAVELDPDNSITVNARTTLQAGRDLSDIMFIPGVMKILKLAGAERIIKIENVDVSNIKGRTGKYEK